jgi:hypothetical protein
VQAAFSIEPSVEGTFQQNGDSIIFTSSKRLKDGTTYTIRISTSVRDHLGNRLMTPSDATFKTKRAAEPGNTSLLSGTNLLFLLLLVIIIVAVVIAVLAVSRKRSKGGDGTPPPPEEGLAPPISSQGHVTPGPDPPPPETGPLPEPLEISELGLTPGPETGPGPTPDIGQGQDPGAFTGPGPEEGSIDYIIRQLEDQ